MVSRALGLPQLSRGYNGAWPQGPFALALGYNCAGGPGAAAVVGGL